MYNFGNICCLLMFVKNIIEFGYVILFIYLFLKVVLKNNRLVFIYSDFVYIVIDDFLFFGCIYEVFEDSIYVVNLFIVLVNVIGKKRLVLDL